MFGIKPLVLDVIVDDEPFVLPFGGIPIITIIVIAVVVVVAAVVAAVLISRAARRRGRK